MPNITKPMAFEAVRLLQRYAGSIHTPADVKRRARELAKTILFRLDWDGKPMYPKGKGKAK